MQERELEMLKAIERISTREDLSAYLNQYVEELGHSLELDKLCVGDFLFKISAFVGSSAGQGIDPADPVWRSLARVLIYSIDYE